MEDKDFTAIRCEGERKHTVKGVEYEQCGAILAGINTCDQIIQCRVCKRWWHLESDGEEIVMTELENGKDIKFKDRG